MSTARELYKDCLCDGEFDSPGNYQPILESFGSIAIQVCDDHFSGDSRVLYNVDGRIGHLIFGWGSCSGCDALQACSSYEDIDEVIDHLRSSIRWFDSREEALEFFMKHDWKGDYSWSWDEDKLRDYVTKCIKYLEALSD